VWLDYEKFGSYLTTNIGCTGVQCGILVKNNIKYRMIDNGATSLTAASVAAFLAADAGNTLKPFTKSQEIPANPIEDNVTVLVGKNFESSIQGKNVFVFF